eukprot:RCo046465
MGGIFWRSLVLYFSPRDSMRRCLDEELAENCGVIDLGRSTRAKVRPGQFSKALPPPFYRELHSMLLLGRSSSLALVGYRIPPSYLSSLNFDFSCCDCVEKMGVRANVSSISFDTPLPFGVVALLFGCLGTFICDGEGMLHSCTVW